MRRTLMIELNNFKNMKDVIVAFKFQDLIEKLVKLLSIKVSVYPKNYTQKSIEVLKHWENSRIDDLVWSIYEIILSRNV